jgi:ABC-type uncharacterized transport system substrate-binding protein
MVQVISRFIVLHAFLFLAVASSADTTGGIAIIKSNNLAIYQPTIASFKKSLKDQRFVEYSLKGKSENVDSTFKKINASQPKAVFLLGALALEGAIRKLDTSIPGVFTFVLRPRKFHNELEGRHFVCLAVEQELGTIFSQARQFLPSDKMKIVAVASSDDYLEERLNEPEPGIERVVVSGNDELKEKITKLSQKGYRAVWLAPDPTLMTQIKYAEIARHAQEKKMALFVYSEAFVRGGGYLSVSINYKTLGNQAAVLTSLGLSNNKWDKKTVEPIGTYLVVNRKLIKEFGYNIPKTTYRYLADVVVD